MKKLSLIICLLSFHIHNCYAFTWQDLWVNQNQQGKSLMLKGDYKAALKKFTDNDWQATAAFRAKDYQQAAKLYAKTNTATANYNLGNALAYLGKYENAILAYNQAIKLNKNDKDAIHNKKIIEELLKQQKQQPDQNNQATNQENPNQDHQQMQKNSNNQDSNTSRDTNQDKKDSSSEQNTTANKTTNAKDKNKNDKSQANKKSNPTPDNNTKQQMKDQWLKLIPDDPGGLLREKFRRDYLRRRGELNP